MWVRDHPAHSYRFGLSLSPGFRMYLFETIQIGKLFGVFNSKITNTNVDRADFYRCKMAFRKLLTAHCSPILDPPPIQTLNAHIREYSTIIITAEKL